MVFEWILASVLLVSLASLAGIVTLARWWPKNASTATGLVSFAAGALLGVAFLDLLPEALEAGIEAHALLPFALAGLLAFFFVERFLHWHHHHTHAVHDAKQHATAKRNPPAKAARHLHPVSYLNLIGDGIHNFLDGVAIAVAFLAGIPAGIAVTLAVLAHEIPQELGDFAILVHGGFSKSQALAVNFLTALAAVVGAVMAFFVADAIEGAEAFLAAFTAGAFIYIAAADLLPEIHKETRVREAMLQVALLLLGVLVIWGVGQFLAH